MAKTRNFTQHQRAQIQVLHQEGYSCRQIARRLRCSYSGIAYCLQRQRRVQGFGEAGRSGRPKVSTPREDRSLIRISMADRRKGAATLKQDWQQSTGVACSTRTVRRRLLSNGLKSCIARRKPLVTPVQQQRRRQWAQTHRNWTQRQWNKVLWSDESSFKIFSAPAAQRVRRRTGEAFRNQCIVPTVKHGGGSVMVWGCMTAAGVGRLTCVDGTINAAKYCDILRENMLPSARDHFRRGQNYIFQQDNAPCHTANATKAWFRTNRVHVMEWPAQSPDMNPIENLWHTLKKAVAERKPSNKRDLKNILLEEWGRISPNVCRRLVESMPARVTALIRSRGLPTKY